MLGQPLNLNQWGIATMTKFLRVTSLGGDGRRCRLTATPALAVGPNQNSTARARVVKPLTLTWVPRPRPRHDRSEGAGVWTGTRTSSYHSRPASLAAPMRTRPARAQRRRPSIKITGTNNQAVHGQFAERHADEPERSGRSP